MTMKPGDRVRSETTVTATVTDTKAIVFRAFFKDSGPDGQGRRSFVLHWEEPDGVYRPEPSILDGKPVGYRRAQVFFAVPAECFAGLERQGHRVEIATEPNPYEVAHAKRAKSTRSTRRTCT